MKIHIIAVGNRMPAWVEAGYAEYAKRLPRHCSLVLREIPAARRGKGADIKRLVDDEGERITAAIPANTYVIALDRCGKKIDTVRLAAEIKAHLPRGEDMALLIGGPEGLSGSCLKRAQETWSLSEPTLAHPVVRVVVAEQLYRAWSIINNLPYHR